ncbi:hypothetical protein BBL97_04550 [Vibrio parahaemolyticus]|uniref:hypothetical protein n=1 Tax=Vibrio parahaemolyticus TaxID=670 RepID=UPI00084A3418|nr:hypothetical protein [Vibrio parahaemolyticus]ODW92440.1 hypothetical protein BBL95_13135 [Vibrio parahaemolyticus]ODX07171.1 hypothetical protein BBL96_10620 [Vibrio parahaemolyticus]ODX10760.1 hypothetical protein BBL97_04550 [Vibrio parahaemolyticus]ODX14038.1 hypothetical protein BBL98_00630 [Vibrio parahaemolyticus]ODX18088.1 hypothetical protein BBL99_11915 [Vibrio parahaemolyticus]
MKHNLMTVKQALNYIKTKNIKVSKNYNVQDAEKAIRNICDDKYVQSSVVTENSVDQGCLRDIYELFVESQCAIYCLDLELLANDEYPIVVGKKMSDSRILLSEIVNGTAHSKISKYLNKNYNDNADSLIDKAASISKQMTYYELHFVEQ